MMLFLSIIFSFLLTVRLGYRAVTNVRVQRTLGQLGALNLRGAVGLIKEKVLISKIVGQYVDLKQNGPSSFTCTCPFHSDTNPSMGVSDEKGLFHCFACGAGGDAVKFVRDMEHLTFSDAVLKTLKLGGVWNSTELKRVQNGASPNTSPSDMDLVRRLGRIEFALAKAVEFYSAKLLGDSKAGTARSHLIQRRIRPQTAFKFQIGYSPVGGPFSLTANLTSEGFSIEELVEAGLSIKGGRNRPKPGQVQLKDPSAENNFDRFRDRIMIPIRNAQGKVVGFGGRLLEELPTPSKPKYLNSPETAIFKKSSMLFGLDCARNSIAVEGMVVIVEGYFDVIALHDVGIENAVGSMGTMLTKEQLETAVRASKGKVVLLFDADEAGQAATLRVIEQVLPQLTVSGSNVPVDLRVAFLPEITKKTANDTPPKDAADVCLLLGAEAGPAIRTSLAQAVGWKQWSVDRIMLRGLREAEARDQISYPASKLSSDSESKPISGIMYQAPCVLSSSLVLGQNSHSSSSTNTLLTSPDILVKTAAALAKFLGTLDDASDRTILAYYCAERLSGGKSGLRLELETNLLFDAKKHAELQSSNLKVGKIMVKAMTKPLQPNLTARTLGTNSLVQNDSSRDPSDVLEKLTQQQPHNDSEKTKPQTDPLIQLGHSRPVTQKRVPLREDSTNGNSSKSITEDIQEAKETSASDIDIGIITSTESYKTYKTYCNADIGIVWENARQLDRTTFSRVYGRVFGAEKILLSSFLESPELRTSVHRTVELLESMLSNSGQSMWTRKGNKELWKILCDVESERQPQTREEFITDVRRVFSPTSVAYQRFEELLLQSVANHQSGSYQVPELEDFDFFTKRMDLIISQAAIAIKEDQIKDQRAYHIKKIENVDTIDDVLLRGLDDQTSDIARQRDRVAELAESQTLAMKIEDKIISFNGALQMSELLETITNNSKSQSIDSDNIDGPLANNLSNKYIFFERFDHEGVLSRIVEESTFESLGDDEEFNVT